MFFHFSPLRSLFLGYALCTLVACQSPSKMEDAWVSIFNGKDLTGWSPKFTGEPYGVNYKNTFRVVDQKLIASYEDYEHFDKNFGHLFYEEKLSHYKLRLEYRFVGEQMEGGPIWAFKNSGIKFHSRHPSELPLGQELLVAVEAQFIGGNGQDERTTGNVCTAGTHIEMNGELIIQHCTNSNFQAFSDDRWVRMELEVNGNGKVIHRINGEEVLSYEKPQLDTSDPFAKELVEQGVPVMLSEGYIALQAESHPIEFRNIELLKLSQP
jgi:hypothetical protein